MASPGFDELLLASLQADAHVREQAETQLTELLHNHPDTLAVSFTIAMRSSPQIEARQTAAVLFRRYSFHATDSKASFWPRLQPAVQEQVKKQLLEGLTDDTPAEVRHKVCDAVAHVARNLSQAHSSAPSPAASPGGEPPHFWPELLQQLWLCIQSPVPNYRESALRIFSTVPSVFGTQLHRYINEIAGVLGASLQDGANLPVQLAAARAFTTFIQCIPQAHRALFTSLVPLVLQVIGTCLDQQKVEGAQACLESLIELAENEPKFFRAVLRELVVHMCRLASNTAIDDGCRNLSLELLTVMCEAGAGMVRKLPEFVPAMVPTCLKLMMELEDDDEWAKQDDTNDLYDLDSTSSIAEQALDRVCCALGGEATMQLCFQVISEMLSRPEWQARYAALMAISAIGEGCYKKMREHLKAVVDAVIPLLHDANPRVRFAACNALGQLATDFAPRENRQTAVCFQTLFHAQVVPGLCQLTLDVEHPRVQAHAAAALVNFCDGASRTVLEPYLDPMLTHLGNLLSSRFIIVQEQAVTTIATVADAAQEHFKKYYAAFMPHLKHILANARDKTHRLLRGKTLECISLMGLAVGKEMFAADVGDIMTCLQDMHASADSDDPHNSYMISSWARICQILGKDFAPYLGMVMPPLLAAVNVAPDVVELDSDQEVDDDTHDWQYISIEDQRMGIKTSTLEDKRTACEMLCIYARKLEGAFAPYVAQVLPISLKLLKFYFEDGVRRYSAGLMPYLLSALEDNPSFGKPAAVSLWLSTIANPLLECAKNEYDAESLTMELDALCDCIERVGTDGLPPELLSVLTGVLRELLEEYKARGLARLQERTQDEDYDAEAETKLKDDEENDTYIIQHLCDIVHELFDVLRHSFLPYFDTLLPLYVDMLAPARSSIDRQWALCVFDDLVEACGAASATYAHFFVDAMLRALTDADAGVRQAACYGIGMMALHGGPEYLASLQAAVPLLVGAINDPRARAMGNIDATENAISAFVKISSNPACGITLEQSVPPLLQWLPFTEDVEEASYVYKFLCDLIAKGTPIVMERGNLVRVLEAFATSTDSGVLDEEAEASVAQAVRHVRAVVPPAEQAQLFAALSVGAQKTLTDILAAPQA